VTSAAPDAGWVAVAGALGVLHPTAAIAESVLATISAGAESF
jgi:hypothetical protein